ncbi:MAG: hypothetical protein IJU04_06975 [Ruminococcus sp.]|nr:hypothetical protein [Ruminococcus sp.]
MIRLKYTIPVVAMIMLSGCSAISFGVDGLISAPKLTKQQSEIHEALEESVGSDITLKYPKSGDNRSAYVVSNIDDEQGKEAIVFYEYNTAGKKEGLWLNVLDCNDDDEWVSVSEIACPGSDISEVIISTIGNDEKKNVIVGYQSISGEEKTLEVYRYSNNSFKSICTDNYSVLETMDINNDKAKELVIIQKNAKEGSDGYQAAFYQMEKNKLVKSKSVGMSDDVESYVNDVKGSINKKTQALYLDYLTKDNTLKTEILTYKDGSLFNLVKGSDGFYSQFCTRPTGYYSMDIDDDGKIEIPCSRTMLGYENAVENDIEYMTAWSVYDEKTNLLLEKIAGYYSVSDGYVMVYPSRWNDMVTVKKDSASGEIVFYKYEGDVNAEMTELIRVAAISNTDKQEYLDNGYELINTKEQMVYMAKISDNADEPLVPTMDEIKNSFLIVE